MSQEETDLFSICSGFQVEAIAGFVFLFFCLLIFIVGGVLASGVALGMLAAIGFAVILYKVRGSFPRMYGFLVKHPLMTDVAITGAGYLMFGLSVNGMIAAAVFGIVTTVSLLVVGKYDSKLTSSLLKAEGGIHKQELQVIDVSPVDRGGLDAVA